MHQTGPLVWLPLFSWAEKKNLLELLTAFSTKRLSTNVLTFNSWISQDLKKGIKGVGHLSKPSPVSPSPDSVFHTKYKYSRSYLAPRGSNVAFSAHKWRLGGKSTLASDDSLTAYITSVFHANQHRNSTEQTSASAFRLVLDVDWFI